MSDSSKKPGPFGIGWVFLLPAATHVVAEISVSFIHQALLIEIYRAWLNITRGLWGAVLDFIEIPFSGLDPVFDGMTLATLILLVTISYRIRMRIRSGSEPNITPKLKLGFSGVLIFSASYCTLIAIFAFPSIRQSAVESDGVQSAVDFFIADWNGIMITYAITIIPAFLISILVFTIKDRYDQSSWWMSYEDASRRNRGSKALLLILPGLLALSCLVFMPILLISSFILGDLAGLQISLRVFSTLIFAVTFSALFYFHVKYRIPSAQKVVENGEILFSFAGMILFTLSGAFPFVVTISNNDFGLLDNTLGASGLGLSIMILAALFYFGLSLSFRTEPRLVKNILILSMALICGDQIASVLGKLFV